MKRVGWALALALIGAAGWLARDRLFPSQTALIDRMLTQLARDVSFAPGEGNIAAVRRISQVVDRFAPDASIEIELLGLGTYQINGRDGIRERLMLARRAARRLELNFHDPVVRLGSDGTSAEVHLTATADAQGVDRTQGGFEALEFSMQLHKLDGRWVIQRVTTVPTLRQ
ncbi:MAG TPA: nuclear transport factor 2 family protein [Verrucomicrobiota bacterium]|nr:hypothetical protein [Verrucomicrobiales bacterium]HRI13322.1 nuclear transport factor 2 family protein [Verrucomicrobiota bacterium]